MGSAGRGQGPQPLASAHSCPQSIPVYVEASALEPQSRSSPHLWGTSRHWQHCRWGWGGLDGLPVMPRACYQHPAGSPSPDDCRAPSTGTLLCTESILSLLFLFPTWKGVAQLPSPREEVSLAKAGQVGFITGRMARLRHRHLSMKIGRSLGSLAPSR